MKREYWAMTVGRGPTDEPIALHTGGGIFYFDPLRKNTIEALVSEHNAVVAFVNLCEKKRHMKKSPRAKK